MVDGLRGVGADATVGPGTGGHRIAAIRGNAVAGSGGSDADAVGGFDSERVGGAVAQARHCASGGTGGGAGQAAGGGVHGITRDRGSAIVGGRSPTDRGLGVARRGGHASGRTGEAGRGDAVAGSGRSGSGAVGGGDTECVGRAVAQARHRAGGGTGGGAGQAAGGGGRGITRDRVSAIVGGRSPTDRGLGVARRGVHAGGRAGEVGASALDGEGVGIGAAVIGDADGTGVRSHVRGHIADNKVGRARSGCHWRGGLGGHTELGRTFWQDH